MVIKVFIILAYYKQSFKTIVKTDFSNYVSSGILFQLDKNRLLYLNALFFKNLNFA